MLKIGHRGAPYLATENTIPSFRKALELGADGIELDVHLCASGELVVFHDFAVNRLTQGQGEVRDLSLAELRALPFKTSGNISTLEEVLDALGKEIYYFVELKPASAILPAVALLERYKEAGWRHLILISFQHEILKHAPSFPVGATFEALREGDVQAARAMNAQMVLPAHGALTKAQVDEAHALGLQVIPWTVNDPADIARMKALGVDGMMSDYPDLL